MRVFLAVLIFGLLGFSSLRADTANIPQILDQKLALLESYLGLYDVHRESVLNTDLIHTSELQTYRSERTRILNSARRNVYLMNEYLRRHPGWTDEHTKFLENTISSFQSYYSDLRLAFNTSPSNLHSQFLNHYYSTDYELHKLEFQILKTWKNHQKTSELFSQNLVTEKIEEKNESVPSTSIEPMSSQELYQKISESVRIFNESRPLYFKIRNPKKAWIEPLKSSAKWGFAQVMALAALSYSLIEQNRNASIVAWFAMALKAGMTIQNIWRLASTEKEVQTTAAENKLISDQLKKDGPVLVQFKKQNTNILKTAQKAEGLVQKDLKSPHSDRNEIRRTATSAVKLFKSLQLELEQNQDSLLKNLKTESGLRQIVSAYLYTKRELAHKETSLLIKLSNHPDFISCTDALRKLPNEATTPRTSSESMTP